jgi:hypothetical protein
VLVLIDATRDRLSAACPALLATGARHLPLHAHPEVPQLAGAA